MDAGSPPCRVDLPRIGPVWLITGYEMATRVLADPRFSSDSTHPGFPQVPATTGTVHPGLFRFTDPPEHTRLRTAVTREFSARRMRLLRPVIDRIVAGRIDRLLAAGPGADFVALVAEPVPIEVICQLLGVPVADHEPFQYCARSLLRGHSSATARMSAATTLIRYLSQLVARKRLAPTNDLIGRLLARDVAHGTMSEAEVAGVAHLMLIAGHETTTNMIALGTLTLMRHPDQFTALCRDPSPARAQAVLEELLRYLTVVRDGLARVATTDVVIGQTVIRRGEGTLVLLPAANHDPGEFPHPDAFDTGRPTPRHLAFGHGPHQCLGQALGRAELESFLIALATRLPALRLAVPLDELRFDAEPFVSPVARLPVRW